MATGAIIARIITQYSAKGSKQAQKDITKLGKDFDKFAKRSAKAFGIAAAASAAFATKIGVDAVQAAMSDQKSQALLASTLRNTVGATDAVIASTEQYITALQKEVSVADDELRPALATLARATGDVASAQSLLGTALNVSAGTGKDLQTVTLALAKASNGNLGALTKVGIQLDAGTIKSKDFNKALSVLNSTFKDQADVRAKTLEFRLKGLQIAYGEILETLGYALLPVVEQFASVISTKVLPQLEAWINANKDQLAASLDTILTKLPALIIQVFNLFDYIQRNIKTIQVFGAVLLTAFASAKVFAGIIALTGAVRILAVAFGAQAAAATAAGIATGLATAGASIVAATAAFVAFKALTKNNKVLDQTKKTTSTIAKNYTATTVATGKVLGNTIKLTAEQKKQLATQTALNKLKAMGVTPTSETDPIQLEAVRLNLLKEQNLAQKNMYDQLLANYNATERMNIAAQRYADILMVIADEKISSEEVNLLASKWNLTNYQVLQYIASVTGNVNLGSGWDAAGLAAGEGWKTALAELNKYLAAVGKGSFVIPPGGNIPAPIIVPPIDIQPIDPKVIDKITKDIVRPEVIPSPMTTMPGYQEFRAGERGDKPKPLLSSQLPDYQSYRAGERGSINVTVNNAGNTVVQSDLQESIRNGLLAGQTSGRSINARKLDL
jgi:hypothetical protein